jgi:ABC-type lipoprotein export system ATPase subunit
MPNTETAIQLEHVSRQYNMGGATIRAVNDVSLSIARNEFLALLGSSGSGKSTLLNLIAGLDRPTAGSIMAQGQNLAELTSIELARYRCNTIGMIFQSFNLLPRMTLADEPTGNLDSATGEAILSLLRDVQRQLGMTIVMVTHERPLAERYADRLAIMGDGKLLSASETVKEDAR